MFPQEMDCRTRAEQGVVAVPSPKWGRDTAPGRGATALRCGCPHDPRHPCTLPFWEKPWEQEHRCLQPVKPCADTPRKHPLPLRNADLSVQPQHLDWMCQDAALHLGIEVTGCRQTLFPNEGGDPSCSDSAPSMK